MKSETRRIGAFDYTVTALDAIKGRKAFVRLSKVLGPALAAAFQDGEVAGIAKLCESLSEADMDYFCDLFAAVTSVALESGKSPQLSSIFLTHFSGEYAAMCEWLYFCVELNFQSFFDAVGEKLGKKNPPSPPPA